MSPHHVVNIILYCLALACFLAAVAITESPRLTRIRVVAAGLAFWALAEVLALLWH